MLTFFRPMGGAARILPKTRFIGGVFCYARGVVLRGFRIGACHIGRVSCCTQCVDPFGGNDSACMYGVFVHGAIVSKDARFVYGLLRPKFRVSHDFLPSPLVKEVAYGEDLRWFRRSMVKEGLYWESRKPFTGRKAPFAEHGREDAERFLKR